MNLSFFLIINSIRYYFEMKIMRRDLFYYYYYYFAPIKEFRDRRKKLQLMK